MPDKLNIIMFTQEAFETERVDVKDLFGKYLPTLGVSSDWVSVTCEDQQEPKWGGGKAIVATCKRRAFYFTLIRFGHGIREMLRLDPSMYDAMQVRDMPILALFGMIVARIRGLPFVYYMSFPFPEGHINNAISRGFSEGFLKYVHPMVNGVIGSLCLYKIVLRYSNHVFVQSDAMRDWLSTKGVALDKMTVVPMGVDFERVLDQVIDLDNENDLRRKRYLVYLGTMDRSRNIEIMFEMLALINVVEPEVCLVLVGDTHDKSHRKYLENVAKKFYVSHRVIWTGWLPINEALGYVRGACVGLSPIPRGPLLDVGSPTKLLEYLALGVPVVCNDNPDQALVIDSTGAGLCVPYTADSFASAVLQILHDESGVFIKNAETIGREYIMRERSYGSLSKIVAESYFRLIG